jgi:hypothetical protein
MASTQARVHGCVADRWMRMFLPGLQLALHLPSSVFTVFLNT